MKRIFICLLALLLALPCGALSEMVCEYSIDDLSGSRAENAAIAADSVTGCTLESGDVFSFNDCVGPRVESCGFVSARNGRGVTVTGGGVAIVASALWKAIQNSDDFAIVEKKTYGKNYTGTYVDSSADAIMVDYNTGSDFRFRYTGKGSVTIYASLEDGTLIIEFLRG